MATRKSNLAKTKCALCGAKEVSEPRGEERYCRDCWEKKIAVEEIVAREFALKRYIRAHSAEKYLIYHSTLKRPCGQLIVVDDGYDLFLTMMLYPSFAWDEPAYHLDGDLLVPAVAAVFLFTTRLGHVFRVAQRAANLLDGLAGHLLIVSTPQRRKAATPN